MVNLMTVHNVAASEGSICSQFFAAASNSVLASEVYPLSGMLSMADTNNAAFAPSQLLSHIVRDSTMDLSRRNRLSFFSEQLRIGLAHAKSIKKNLLLREHGQFIF